MALLERSLHLLYLPLGAISSWRVSLHIFQPRFEEGFPANIILYLVIRSVKDDSKTVLINMRIWHLHRIRRPLR